MPLYHRYPVSLHYISMISESMLKIKHITALRFRMCVAFVVYQLCDKDILSKVCVDEFLKITQEYNFSSKLFRVLEEHNINESSFLNYTIKHLVVDELEKFYKALMHVEDTDENNQCE